MAKGWGKKKITGKGLLQILSEVDEMLYPLSFDAQYKKLYRNRYQIFSQYVPSVTKRVTGRLLRKGWVEKQETSDGLIIKITNKGKREILRFKLEELVPKIGKWDGKWKMVFFDVAEIDRLKRDRLRRYLKMLGLKQMQESVWVGPYDVAAEVKYIREILDIPHGVKLGILEQVENNEDLREMFGV